MVFIKKGRYLFWIARDLTIRHTRFLVIGFVLGFIISISFWQVIPYMARLFIPKIERIGYVGEFEPANLPLPIRNKISSGLTTLNQDGSVSPGLASWWEASDSGKTYVFHIKEGTLWHNGDAVESKDINYNIKNVTFTFSDKYTVKVQLDFPYSPFPILVSKPLFKSGLIGFGDYKVSQIQLKGDKVQVLKLTPILVNSNRKELLYTFYPTESKAILAYKQGDIDEITELSNPQSLVGWGNTRIDEIIKYNRIVALFFNLKDNLLSEKSFRQALGYALPALSQEKAISPIPKISWAYTDKVRRFEPDKNQVTKLLASAKIASASSQLTITTFNTYIDTAQEIVNNWNTYGFKTIVKVENLVPDDYQILLTAIEVPPDPDQYPFWHSTQQGTNITGYSNVKNDKLLEDGRQQMDIEERKKIYSDFARRLVDDAPAIFLYYPKAYSIKRNK
jgi:peptide/nickel transport system substrate-binding protein